jgi:beta-galactosidase
MRTQIELRTGWTFHLGEAEGAERPECDDAGWESVVVPHDWAIRGPFDEDNDAQTTMILEDGERKPRKHTGRTGGLPTAGVAWYRKTFSLSEDDRGRRCFVEFDGAMSHARVYLNGEFVGEWPFGYSSFHFELTDLARFGGENVLAVRLEPKPSASRWYPGAGIYRHARLVMVDPVHVGHWGTYVTTPEVSEKQAVVRVWTEVLNQGDGEQAVRLETAILDPSGRCVASASSTGSVGTTSAFDQSLTVEKPELWSCRTPRLYRAVSAVFADDAEVDVYETRFGIRDVAFDKDKGFFLNGEPMKLNGVCMHHDLGPLGSAVSRRAVERQFEILKDMGANALRTSHNPPAPEVLDVCDELGFVVLDEAFDEWRQAKVKNGYSTLFDAWAEKDLRAMIRRDRNHPCVIMWSIGNEIREQGDEKEGAKTARFLTDICHDEDPTRPTTAGYNNSDAAIENGLADAVDIPGWNYKPARYREYRDAHPDWTTYGSETCSTISSRGEYFFPVAEEKHPCHPSLQVSSYNLSTPRWGTLPDEEFAAQDDCPFILGEFVWTGFDYIGEPTPYNVQWPSRSSYFGIVDLCGIPKDRYFLYRAKWNPGAETLHLLPHWTWPGREGEITPVHCYTNRDSAELFLNGRSLGVRKKDPASKFGRYRLIWDDVKYEPGVLKVVALDAGGKPVAEVETQTAGPPARIELAPDRSVILADGKDLSFVSARVLDARGVVCPDAGDLVQFHVEGPGRIAAVGNGDATSLEPFSADRRKAFHGQCMLIAGSNEGQAGELRVAASAEGLEGASIRLTCEAAP